MTITSGVPQGSVLGPLLFILYINDIQNCSTIISNILFADDTTIFYSHAYLKTLNQTIQEEINKIAVWLNINKLSINTEKNNKIIEQVRKTTFLGIVVDECLTWNDHLEQISKKIIKSTAVIVRIRHFINLKALKIIYYALVYPCLIYGNVIWDNTYKKRTQKLVNIQKKIIRLMTFNSYFEHTEPIFKELKLLSIYKLNQYLTSLFMVAESL